ncbi:MAG: HEAT repeat domain-containing protein [Pseudomonadota bacterium]
MAHQPPLPSIRLLQVRAKQLVKAHRIGDAAAIRFINKFGRASDTDEPLSVTVAYQAIAHHSGCRDWSALKNAIAFIREIDAATDYGPTNSDLDTLVTLLGVRYPVAAWAFRYLQREGSRGHQAVLRGMQHRSAKVRRACTDYLDHAVPSWDDATYQRLEAAIDDPTPKVRASVLHALGCQRCKDNAPDEHAIDLFMHGMTDASAKVRRTAVGGMWQFRHDVRVHDGLLKALEDESSRVRKTAAAALASCVENPRVPRALIERLVCESNLQVIQTLLMSVRPAATKFVGQHRDAIVSKHGSGVEGRVRTENTKRPPTLFYPLGILAGDTSAGADSRYWLRFILDAEGIVRSATAHDGMAEI